MKKSLLLLLAVILISVESSAQSFTKAADDAYLVTHMVQKFHFQPRVVNNQFSSDVLNKFLNSLDGQRIFFTQEDIRLLSKFKYLLDDHIKSKTTDFLAAIYPIYQKRLLQAQGIMDIIGQSSLNLYSPEKFTVAEDTSWPVNAAAQKIKISKIVRLALLNALVKGNDEINSLSEAEQKKYLQKNEPDIRQKIQKAFRRSINTMLQNPGGLLKVIGDEYCKSIALCFDAHTEYLPATEKQILDTELGDREIGLGFSLIADKKGNVFINDIKPGSPAYKSGQINRGDRVISLQWEGSATIDLTGATVKEITDALNANHHLKVTLTFRKADGTKRDVALAKEKLEDDIEENKVKSFVLKGPKAIGYISLPSFYEDWENEKGINGCANDVAKEIVRLKKEKIDGLIIDIRFNSGGSMQEAIELAGIFIDAGPLAQYRSAKKVVSILKDINKGTIYDGPLLLLVNGYTASASEMVAAVLQDYNRAIIAGSPTYGKATSQLILPLDSTVTLGSDLSKSNAESFIKITVAEVIRVTGKPIQSVGIIPDIQIPAVYGDKEKDNNFALPGRSVSPNKYYIPLAPLSFKKLNAVAKQQLDSSEYFTHLKKILDKQSKAKQKDVSLQVNDVLALQPIPPANTVEGHKLFSVDNHSSDNKIIFMNIVRKEINASWRKNISQDAYIRLAYTLMAQSIIN